jgi:hypothetical protein
MENPVSVCEKVNYVWIDMKSVCVWEKHDKLRVIRLRLLVEMPQPRSIYPHHALPRAHVPWVHGIVMERQRIANAHSPESPPTQRNPSPDTPEREALNNADPFQ